MPALSAGRRQLDAELRAVRVFRIKRGIAGELAAVAGRELLVECRAAKTLAVACVDAREIAGSPAECSRSGRRTAEFAVVVVTKRELAVERAEAGLPAGEDRAVVAAVVVQRHAGERITRLAAFVDQVDARDQPLRVAQLEIVLPEQAVAAREIQRVERRRIQILARIADRKAMAPVRAEIAFEIDARVLLDHVRAALIERDIALAAIQRSGQQLVAERVRRTRARGSCCEIRRRPGCTCNRDRSARCRCPDSSPKNRRRGARRPARCSRRRRSSDRCRRCRPRRDRCRSRARRADRRACA